jgi:predicted nucleic acid-binding protein
MQTTVFTRLVQLLLSQSQHPCSLTSSCLNWRILILRELGYPALTTLLRSVATGELVQVKSTPKDLERAAEVLEKYADSRVDFVDCAIVAMAERLNMTRILTVDRRHFTIFRPRHCDYFEIVP